MSIERPLPRRQHGFTLVELIVFIVIVGVGLAGILAVFNVTVRSSADPMIRKQMLSIAEALLDEVEAQPFTYCDPTDGGWSTATAATTAGGCAIVQGLGPGSTGQVRFSATVPFNNVGDYSGASGDGSPAGTTGLGDATHRITDVAGAAAAPLGYYASIAMTPEPLGGIPSGNCVSGSDCSPLNVLRITVTVSHGADSLQLEGYRARYWPNDQPW